MKKYNFLGTENIKKLLFKQSLPSIIGLLVLSLYQIADTIFIGRGVGSLGIAGIAIALPIQMIAGSIAYMLGIGSASIISRALGNKDYKTANKAFGNFFTLSLLSSLFLTIIGLIFLDEILIIFGATENILPYARDYLQVMIIGTVFSLLAMGANNLIRAEGAASFSMKIMLVSAVINLILDPIFIFTLDMGMRGAAIATVIAQFFAVVTTIYYFIKKSSLGRNIKDYYLSKKIVFEKISIGASTFARQVAGSIMAIMINHSLAYYGGDISISVFGVINRLIIFVIMPLFGIIHGMQPIVGFNHGANNKNRVKETIRLSNYYATIFATIGFLILIIFTKPIVNVFTNDIELINNSILAIRIVVMMLPLIGFQIIVSGVYQSLGNAKKAFIFSIMRQVLFHIPLLLILPPIYGLNGIWISFAATDLFSFIVTYFIFRKDMKKY